VAALHRVIRFPLRLYDIGHVEDAASDRWRQAREVLRAHPSAQLTALNEVGLFVPLPPGMDGAGHEQLLAASGREAVEPVDHTLVTEAWARLLSDGYATTQVRCRRYPEHLTRIELFDVRPAFGVFAAVTYATAVRERAAAPEGPTGDAWPRLGQVRKDLRAVITHADQAAERMLGYPPGGLVGVESRELVHPDDQDLAVQSWLELSSRPGGMERVRLRERRADGSWLWVEVINHNRLQDPAYGCVVADVVDVSQEMAFREDVRTQERLLRRLTEALPVGVVQLLPTGEVAYSNERVHQILGTPARSSLDRLLDPLCPGDKARVLSSFTTAVLVGVDDDLHVGVPAGAADRNLEVALRPLIDDAGAVEGVLVCLTDVTEDMRLRAELEQRATYDVLTGCLNRGAVLRRLDEELRTMAAGRGCVVLFLDLDGFKHVNDTRGHAAGDDVLREVAAVLRSASRAGDAVGRLGGDEFVLICPRIGSADEALALAVDVQSRLRRSQPCDLPSWGASTGVTWANDPSLSAEAVLGRADAAMYDAKQERRQRVVLWRGPSADAAVARPRSEPADTTLPR